MEGVGRVREGEREGEKSERTSERERERGGESRARYPFPPLFFYLLLSSHPITVFYFYYFTIHYGRFRREGMQHVLYRAE